MRAAARSEATLHPPRVGADQPVEEVPEVDQLGQLVDPLVHFAAGQAVEAALEAEQFGAGLLGVERRLLQGHADPEAHLPGLGPDVIAGHPGPPPARGQQGAQHVHRRGLPGPVRPEEPVDLAGGDPQVDTGDGSHPVEVPHQGFSEDGFAGALHEGLSTRRL
jgi:hypothetical protein